MACALAAWRHFYGLDERTRSQYPEVGIQKTPVSFLRSVSYFWIDPNLKHVIIHYNRASLVYKLCVSAVPPERVAERGSFHKSDGHHALMSFSGDKCCYVSCFDIECKQANPVYGRKVFSLPEELYQLGCKSFRQGSSPTVWRQSVQVCYLFSCQFQVYILWFNSWFFLCMPDVRMYESKYRL